MLTAATFNTVTMATHPDGRHLVYMVANGSRQQTDSNATTPATLATATGIESVEEESFMGGVTTLKMIILGGIIVCAVGGNLLVILSVCRYQNLRTKANTFIVSLAFADLLVALLVMPFSASQEVAERWLFERITCDIFNANDVLFSTASLLNLCCISMDRYIAITDPFNYSMRMSRTKVILTLVGVWAASILVSHLPIHLKLYATSAALSDSNSDECSFQVNLYYGIISSFVSFWSPTLVMLFTYKKIYSEAQRQVKQIEALRPKTPPSPNIALSEFSFREISKTCSSSRSSEYCGNCHSIPMRLASTDVTTLSITSDGSIQSKFNNSSLYVSSRLSLSSNHLVVNSQPQRNKNNWATLKVEAIEEGSLPRKVTLPSCKRSFSNLFPLSQQDSRSQQAQAASNENRRRLRKEHKAAKTLGVIMGVFLGCWLPFFIWYLTSSICQDYCHTPKVVVSVLFWVGYTNSALNPIIYACFNREFRGAFRRQLCYCRRWFGSGRMPEIGVSSDKTNWRCSNDFSTNKKEEV